MRRIPYGEVVEAVRRMCMEAACDLPDDVTAAVERALAAETDPRGRAILEELLENARIAKRDRIPLCQDTGLTIVFVELGRDVRIEPPAGRPDRTLADAIQDGVAAGSEDGLLRKSVVAEPLHERLNTQTNTPAIIHTNMVAGDGLHLSVMLKGGGCENKSQFRMFNPTESSDRVAAWIVQVVRDAGANACPPFVVGVGLGGDFETCCLLSKKALLREIGSTHADPFYADLEHKLLAAVNASGLGPQGLGGLTTALAVHVEAAPCHIASLPAAVNIECHAHRHKSARL